MSIKMTNDRYKDLLDFGLDVIFRTHPHIDPNSIESAEILNEYDILVRYKNGTKVVYDTYSNDEYYPIFNKDITKENVQKDFGFYLNKMMFRTQTTQAELAQKIGTTQAMISRYLNGENMPSYYTVIKIAKALKCSVEDFCNILDE